MAILYTTGPAHLFLGFGAGLNLQSVNKILYLGTAEEKPRIKIRRSIREAKNDIAGDIPMDLQYMGQEAFIAYDLTRYNEPVYAQLAAFPHTALGVGTDGTDQGGDIGTLAVTEGQTVVVYVQFPYNTVAPYRANGMPAGYRFPYSVPLDDDLDPIGTRYRNTHIMFRAIRGYNPVNGQQMLYDHNLNGLPTPN